MINFDHNSRIEGSKMKNLFPLTTSLGRFSPNGKDGDWRLFANEERKAAGPRVAQYFAPAAEPVWVPQERKHALGLYILIPSWPDLTRPSTSSNR
jgi:hypothetical protein